MSTLIVVAGLPGTGKTTLCKLLRSKLGCYFFDSDKYAMSSPVFKSVDSSKLSQRQLNYLRLKFYKHKVGEVKRLLLTNNMVVMDAVFDLPKLRKLIYDMVESIGARLVIIEMVCPDSLTKKRILADKTKIRPGASPESRLVMYERMKASWKPIKRKHSKVNSNNSLLPQVADLIKQLKK